MSELNTWRLLLSGAGSGTYNMAVDEALLECARLPVERWWSHTLRLYWFSPPSLSIGAYQPIEEVDLTACMSAGVTVVRRPTGGRAVLHDRDITYSLCGPAGGPLFDGGVRPSYRRIAAALVAAVDVLGASGVSPAPADAHAPAGPSCFDGAAPYELLVQGHKIAGSAQVRRGGTALQHGSIRLENGAIAVARLLSHRIGRPEIRSVEEPPVLTDLVGVPVSREQAAAALQQSFANTFNLCLIAGELTHQERELAAQLARERYSQPDWTERR